MALRFSAPTPKFNYTDASGKKQSVEIVDKYYPKKIVQPIAKADAQIDPKLRRAATIAEERARAHSLSKCWRFVKEALVASGVVKSRPQTVRRYRRTRWEAKVACYNEGRKPCHRRYPRLIAFLIS
jgi:hypothetical protein